MGGAKRSVTHEHAEPGCADDRAGEVKFSRPVRGHRRPGHRRHEVVLDGEQLSRRAASSSRPSRLPDGLFSHFMDTAACGGDQLSIPDSSGVPLRDSDEDLSCRWRRGQGAPGRC